MPNILQLFLFCMMFSACSHAPVSVPPSVMTNVSLDESFDLKQNETVSVKNEDLSLTLKRIQKEIHTDGREIITVAILATRGSEEKELSSDVYGTSELFWEPYQIYVTADNNDVWNGVVHVRVLKPGLD